MRFSSLVLVAAAGFSAPGCGTPGDTPPDGGPLDVSVVVDPRCQRSGLGSYSVQLQGSGFGAYEDRAVYGFTSLPFVSEPGLSCGAGTGAIIRGGSFTLAMTNVTDGAVYPWVGLYVDRDSSGTCDPAEPAWGWVGAFSPTNTVPYTFQLSDLTALSGGMIDCSLVQTGM